MCVYVHKHKKGFFVARVGQSHPVLLLPLLESQCQCEKRAMNERKSAASGEKQGIPGWETLQPRPSRARRCLPTSAHGEPDQNPSLHCKLISEVPSV